MQKQLEINFHPKTLLKYIKSLNYKQLFLYKKFLREIFAIDSDISNNNISGKGY